MDYRQAHILHGLIAEYINTAQPVGSTHLVEKLGLPISSATMRNILRELENKGYIQQPHTSAGRMPTDKGYRYYVDNLAFREPDEKHINKLAQRYNDYQDEYEHPARASAKMLSQLSHMIAISGWLNEHDIHEAGLSRLLDEPESHSTIKEVSALLDNIDAYIEQFASQPGADVHIYIGKENPIIRMEYTSVLVRTTCCENGERIVMLLIGPKRMSYENNVPLLNDMASMFESISL